MKRFAAIAGLSLIGVCAAAQAEPPALNYKQAPELAAFFDKAFGDKFKIAGDPQIMTSDQSVRLFTLFSLRPVLSVPVAFKRTARLDEDVVIESQLNEKDPLILHKGTTLYHTAFRRDTAAESRPIEAWCGLASHRIWKPDRTTSECLIKTPEGKALAYNGDTWQEYDNQFTMENTKGGAKAPRWFAFGLNDGPNIAASLPVDYPAITETDLPSPDMAIILRFDQPIKDKAGNDTLLATWALRGPAGDIPTTGPLAAFEIPVQDGQIRVPMLDHELDANYAPEDKTLSALKITSRDMPVVQIVPLPASPAAEIIDAPWLFGSMMIDPKSVAVSPSPLAEGDIFLSASGHLGDRYRLKAATHGGFGYYEAGASLYRAEYTGYEANGEKYKISAWCGPGEMRTLLNLKFVICTPANPDGGRGTYFVKNWELIGFMKSPQQVTDYIPVDVERDPDPAPETRQFQMRVTKVNASVIGLKLGLLTDDHFTMQERYDIPFGPDGKARLYLWDRIVEFSHDQGQVTAKVFPGDGHGPRYGKLFVQDGGY